MDNTNPTYRERCTVKEILNNLSSRWGHDGWAIKRKGTKGALEWTVCTTRAEARELRDKLFSRDIPSLNREDFEIVKVRVSVTPLPTEADTA